MGIFFGYDSEYKESSGTGPRQDWLLLCIQALGRLGIGLLFFGLNYPPVVSPASMLSGRSQVAKPVCLRDVTPT